MVYELAHSAHRVGHKLVHLQELLGFPAKGSTGAGCTAAFLVLLAFLVCALLFLMCCSY